MNRELLDQVLKSLDAMIADELKLPDVGRYDRIARLCGHAHKLLQMGVTRVKDVRDRAQGITNLIDHDGGVYFQGGEQYGGGEIGVEDAMGAGIQYGAQAVMGRRTNGGDMTDMFRELVQALDSAGQRTTRGPVPAPLEQAERLLELRERLAELGRDTSVVDNKLDEAVQALAKETSNADPSLARPLLLRRHPARLDGPEVVHGGNGAAHREGAGGAAEPGEEGEGQEVDHGR